MAPISFKRHRFPPTIIQHAVWLYARFTLSFRDIEDLLAERGVDVWNETVRRWFLKFGRLIAGYLRRRRAPPSSNWHLDEMVIKIRGRKHWLCVNGGAKSGFIRGISVHTCARNEAVRRQLRIYGRPIVWQR